MTLTTGRLESRLRGQFPLGVATVRQLVEFGYSERNVYRRCLPGGPWRRALPGVVALFTGHPTRDQQVRAALLLCGPGAVVTGLEACRRHGIRRGPLGRPHDPVVPHEVHTLIPADRQVRSVGYLHIERTKRMPTSMVRDGVPLAPVPRACSDAVRRLQDHGTIAELLSDAVQRGLCTVAALSDELNTGSRRGTAVPRAVLADVAAGIRSAAELDARKLWAASGLPEPRWNARICTRDGRLVGIADCWVDEVAMVWEIESTEFHLNATDHELTVDRAAEFTAAGCFYLASKPRRIRSDRRGVTELLRATYGQALTRPRPALVAVRSN